MTKYPLHRMAVFVAVVASAVQPRMAAAQEAAVEFRLESNTLEVGEVADAQLVCTNIGQPSVPVIQAPDGLAVEITNPIPAQFSQMSLINGRRSQKVTYTFSVRVLGKKEGVYTIGPIAVEADGTSYQSRPVQVTVTKATTSAGNEADRYVFVRMTAEPRSLYVTQSLTATLTIGIRKIENADGGIIEVDNLLEYVDGSASDISTFPTRFSSSEQWMTDSAGRRHQYVLHKASKEIRAEQVGPLSVGPVFIKVDYPTALRRGFFGRLEATRSRKETARAEAIIIDVKGPPERGRPADFTGAIGRYILSVDATPTRLEHGRAVTLSIAIGGEPLEGLAGPDLAGQSELASRFDFATDELTGDVEGRAKVFRRAVFPRQPGEQTIPSLNWSYFDPQTERYVTLSSKPIPIVVDPPAPGSVALRPSAAEETGANGNVGPLTVLGGGIAPNYVDAHKVLADQSLNVSLAAGTALLALPPLACAAIALGWRRRQRVMTDVGYARRLRAKRLGHERIASALRAKTVADQLGGLAHALTGFVCDLFDLSSGERTPQEIRAALAAHGIDVPLANEVARFLDTCDAARYAPGSAGALSPDTAARQVRTWITQIDRDAR